MFYSSAVILRFSLILQYRNVNDDKLHLYAPPKTVVILILELIFDKKSIFTRRLCVRVQQN